MASTVWKGYVSFGLISVPIRLFVAAREEHVSFNQIHKECGTRVKQQLYCPTDQRVVERSELAKGYQVDKDTYVLVTEEELKTLEAESSESMEIQQFVQLDDVDPVYYQTSYYTVPEDPGRKAYALILQGMEQLKLGAIAKITLHQREQIVMIRPYHNGLVLHTLFYPAEVRELAEYGQDHDLKLQKAEIDLAEQFMKQLTAKFDPDQFKDEYQTRVEELIEQKEAGMVQKSEKPKKHLAPVINLMDALRKSMEQQEEAAGKKEPQRETVAAKSTGRKKKAV
ncbi:Ku protein [Alloacidobacterium dinghuense]|uniref:Non-homologous end joining protein Ku n=1 Tax=Alloacidobacterium dinghuense TaxID=2763107 RepID=A0A7G8BCZ5_9BACT|nr:Ku protein [Alloacidobacterium dinghuense]QNI30415.1 Ku protein [Alloacidobacterium dinghuense]